MDDSGRGANHGHLDQLWRAKQFDPNQQRATTFAHQAIFPYFHFLSSQPPK